MICDAVHCTWCARLDTQPCLVIEQLLKRVAALEERLSPPLAGGGVLYLPEGVDAPNTEAEEEFITKLIRAMEAPIGVYPVIVTRPDWDDWNEDAGS